MKTEPSKHIATQSTLLVFALATLTFPSCSSFTGGGLSLSGSWEGGDVPSTIKFQGSKFRTGGAFRATELGSIGLKRTSCANVFELRNVPKITGLDLTRSASFTKSTKSSFKLIGNLTAAEIQNLKAAGSITANSSEEESGIYTIYYLQNPMDLVNQLNKDENSVIRSYLRRSKDFRIVTAVVKVNSHTLLRKGDASLDAQVKALSTEGTAEANSELKSGSGQSNIKIQDDTGKAAGKLPPGLSLADGSTYAYEYSRIIWDKEGNIIDLLADQPGCWFLWTDKNNHHYQGAITDPFKLKH